MIAEFECHANSCWYLAVLAGSAQLAVQPWCCSAAYNKTLVLVLESGTNASPVYTPPCRFRRDQALLAFGATTQACRHIRGHTGLLCILCWACLTAVLGFPRCERCLFMLYAGLCWRLKNCTATMQCWLDEVGYTP